ncbi:MAG: hypothetical protein KDD10_01470 [Phaeodactylibacter sp.]|nr:hypothetical protein [Phaeodactylibacter sp.]MCB9291604.1 hypothetical protein [Lewinellaceae bacterium]
MTRAAFSIFLFLSFSLPFGLSAQVSGSVEDELIEALEAAPSLDGNLSRVVLNQASSNIVEIEQANRQLADIQQSGSYNEIYLTMEGDRNGAAVRQNGDHNLVDILLDGEEATIGVLQDGNDNSLRLDYRNVEEVNARFIQNGSNINVTHTAEDIEGLDYTIEFNGSDMNIQVEDLNQFLK